MILDTVAMVLSRLKTQKQQTFIVNNCFVRGFVFATWSATPQVVRVLSRAFELDLKPTRISGSLEPLFHLDLLLAVIA